MHFAKLIGNCENLCLNKPVAKLDYINPSVLIKANQ